LDVRSLKKHKQLISIVTPFYNEDNNVEPYYKAINTISKQLSVNFELICVDDGSTDNTLTILTSLSKLDPRITILELSRNFGKEAALTAGIEYAKGDAVIPIDGDLQDPPELIHQMTEKWLAGADTVLARRVDRSSDSYLKRRSAELFYRFHNRIADVQIPENVGDYRLMDRQVVDALLALPERQRFMKGIFAWVGFKVEYVDYIRKERAHGESKFSGISLWRLALEGITSFSTSPLKIWTYIGALGTLFASIYGATIVTKTLILGIDVPGYASLLVAILFIGSIQLVGIGVLGEYIGRIYIESKQRPNYIIRKHHHYEP
jgi:glycosyltransferase involved in cell wall biosynthesis